MLEISQNLEHVNERIDQLDGSCDNQDLLDSIKFQTPKAEQKFEVVTSRKEVENYDDRVEAVN